MPSTLHPRPLGPRKYLVRERRAAYRSEYHDGELVAMAGASAAHGRLVANLSTALGVQLGEGPCEHFVADMRVRLEHANFFVYPDVAVVCGPARLLGRDNLLNPVAVFEVLSPGTERDDRGRKAEAYRGLESLRAYVLVAQEEPRVEAYRRGLDGAWSCTLLQRLEDVLALECIGCAFPLAELYRRVFPPADDRVVPVPARKAGPAKYRLRS